MWATTCHSIFRPTAMGFAPLTLASLVMASGLQIERHVVAHALLAGSLRSAQLRKQKLHSTTAMGFAPIVANGSFHSPMASVPFRFCLLRPPPFARVPFGLELGRIAPPFGGLERPCPPFGGARVSFSPPKGGARVSFWLEFGGEGGQRLSKGGEGGLHCGLSLFFATWGV